jgi:hypothetical protein
MGDGPGGRHTDQPQSGGVDFNALINNGLRGPGPEAPQRPQDQQRPGAAPTDSVKIGTDNTNTVVINNHTLELSVNDPNFDNKLLYASQHAADKFDKIKIDDLPSNYKINTWLTKDGYCFYFNDGTTGHKDLHYLPNNAFGMIANNAKIDLDDERVKDNQQFALKNFGGFRNFDRNYVPQKDGAVNSTSYYWQIAGASPDALAIQENALRESVRNSPNPYFKVYLSDIKAAQALQPIRELVDQGKPYNSNNEYTRKKLDESLSLSQAAYDQTKGELGKFNQFPSLNVYLPLAPQRPFWDRNQYPDDYMGFWGGAFNQSYGRQQDLTYLRGLVIAGVVPRVQQLPPNTTILWK